MSTYISKQKNSEYSSRVKNTKSAKCSQLQQKPGV